MRPAVLKGFAIQCHQRSGNRSEHRRLPGEGDGLNRHRRRPSEHDKNAIRPELQPSGRPSRQQGNARRSRCF